MSRAKTIVLASFLTAFVAGVALGVAVGGETKSSRHGSFWADKLNLTSGQREQMHEIWSSACGRAGNYRQQSEAIELQRDEAIRQVLATDQLDQYKQILKDHSDKLDEMRQSRRDIFAQCRERTKEILDDSQRQEYERLLSEWDKSGKRYWRFGGTKNSSRFRAEERKNTDG
jgi:Spy/CpxP family protein refolding chaperone